MAVIFRQPRTAQPQGSVSLDSSSQLNVGAQAVVSFHSGAPIANLATGTPLTRAGTSPVKVATPQGVAELFAKNRYYATELLSIGTGNYTEYWCGYITNLTDIAGSTSDASFLVGSSNNLTGIAQYGGIRSASPTRLGVVNVWANVSATSATLTVGQYACIVSTKVSGTRYVYLNGVEVGTWADSTDYGASKVIIGSFIEDTSYWASGSQTILAGRTLRGWNATQARSFSDNPWQIFAPVARQIWVPTATAPVDTADSFGVSAFSELPFSTISEPVAGGTHPTSGTLTGQGSSVTGTAVHKTRHFTSGTLTGQGSSVNGTAKRTKLHPTTGTLTGQGSSVNGIAKKFRAHPTTGTLTGQSSTVAGTAKRFRTHPTTGTLTGQGSTVTGTAKRTRVHPTTGTLTGQGSAISGTAKRTRVHPTTGVLAGQGAAITGTAVHKVRHATSGTLTGQSSAITGSAIHVAGTVVHLTSGILVGQSTALAGIAAHISLYPSPSDVRAGVQYGPGGIYVGTLTVGAGETIISLRSFTERH